MHVPLLVDDFLNRSALLYPDKPAVINEELEFTYAQLKERVNRLANALSGLGLERGDRVCILSPNSHQFLESFYATSQAGLILVPLNYRLTPQELSYIIDHSGSRAVIVDDEYAAQIEPLRSELPQVRFWIAAPGDSSPAAGWHQYETLVAKSSAEHSPVAGRDENDVVSINYTSGTTAMPKGVMLTHRNVYINAYNLIAHLRVAHDDVMMWTAPMFHCNGWGIVYALTGMGGTHVILRAVEPGKALDLIAKHGVTLSGMAPAVLRSLLEYPKRDEFEFRTAPRFIVAGAPPPESFIERLETEMGWHFLQIYGLTETAPMLTANHVDFATTKDDYTRRARAGSPCLGVELRLVDSDGKEIPRDNETVGEVCAKANVVFAGYWEQPEETEKAISDGYFRTGDLGIWDERGSIHIVDREKDVIISGGENISSPDIESVLYRHPAVSECAVIGVPHERWGETPLALVVLNQGETATETEIIEHCRDKMAHFKCPTAVEFVEELPRTATGKLQKYKLRERWWSGSRRVRG